MSPAITLVIFATSWIGLATTLKQRKLSTLTAVGGGFLGSLVVTVLTAAVVKSSTDWQESNTPQVSSVTTSAAGNTAPNIATALVGEWSCKSDNGSVTRQRYSSDGLLYWQSEAKPNGDAPLDRATSKSYGAFQLSGNKLTFSITRIRIGFAPQDEEHAAALDGAGNFTRLSAGEIEAEMQGAGGSAIIEIDGNTMQYRTISHIKKGVESSRNGPPDTCERVGR